MPRDSSGTYTLPVTAFVTLTTIISGDMNTDLSDIGAALTTSLATTGVSEMSGPVKLANGALDAASLTFNNNRGIGFYRVGANILGLVVTSATVGTVNASATVQWQGDQIFYSSVTIAGAITLNRIVASTSITGGLVVTGGLNIGFSAAPTVDTIKIGDALFGINYNAGTNPEIQFDADDSIGFVAATNIWYIQVSATNAVTIASDRMSFGGALQLPEVTAPASAPTNEAYLYVAQGNQASRPKYKDENGVETVMGGEGYWEIVGTITVASTISSVEFDLTKLYSKLLVTMTSVSPNSTVTAAAILVRLSEDGGTTTEAVDAEIMGDMQGAANDFAITSLEVVSDTFAVTDVDLNGMVEISVANVTGQKGLFWQGNSVLATANQIGSGRSATMGPVNCVRMAFPGDPMDSGRFVLYGMVY